MVRKCVAPTSPCLQDVTDREGPGMSGPPLLADTGSFPSHVPGHGKWAPSAVPRQSSVAAPALPGTHSVLASTVCLGGIQVRVVGSQEPPELRDGGTDLSTWLQTLRMPEILFYFLSHIKASLGSSESITYLP